MELGDRFQFVRRHEFKSSYVGTDIVFAVTARISSLVGTDEREVPVLDIVPDAFVANLRLEAVMECAKTNKIVRRVFSSLGRWLHVVNMDRDA